MRRLLLAAAALAALYPADATPIPADALDPPLFPTAVGTKWVYNGPDSDSTETITAARAHKGVTILDVEIQLQQRGVPVSITIPKKMEVSGRGVAYLSDTGDDAARGWLFHRTTEPNPEWFSGDYSFSRHIRYRAAERVRVAAGVFRAIPIDGTLTFPTARPHNPDVARATVWFAPGVGVVKRRYGSGESYEQLMSFTPGRQTR